jgi:PBP1b-binding outer membrane lipoprotein LpoB
LYKVMKNIPIVTLSTCTVWGCTLEMDATRSVSNTQNATCGAMKSVQVQTTGKGFFPFSATLNALFTLPTLFGKTYLYQSCSKVLFL